MGKDTSGVHDVRQAHRQGVYEWLRTLREAGNEQWMFTLTYADDKQDHEPTEIRFVDTAAKWFRAAGLAAYVVAERGKGDGRLHLHGVVNGRRTAVDEVMAKWFIRFGITHVDPVTDLMGAVFYCTKAVGPETYWTFSVPKQRRIGDAPLR